MSSSHRLLKEYRSFLTATPPVKGIQVSQDPLTTLKWHFLFYDFPAGSPYHTGCYHGILTYPKDYPFHPPNIKMFTPNGRFKTNESLCFSMSDFHPETWNPSWTLETLLVGLYSYMDDPAIIPGAKGSMQASLTARQRFAAE